MGATPKSRDGVLGQRIAARNVLVLLVLGCRIVQTVMRMAMGALVVYACEELVCREGAKGWLLSAHAIGYCSTQIIGGRLADWLGGKAIITTSMLLAGAALLLTPFFSGFGGTTGVGFAQVAMGVAMGPVFPASMQMMARWLPPSERARACTVLDTGITAGSLIALPLSGAIATRFGWRLTLALYGTFSLAFAGVWSFLACDTPAACSYCTDTEREYLTSAIALRSTTPISNKDSGKVSSKWSSLVEQALLGLRFKQLWAIYAAHFGFNFGVYFVNSWSALYYLEVFGLRPDEAGLHLMMPHLTNLGVKVLVNPILDRWFRHAGYTTLGCRRWFTGLGFAGGALAFRIIPSCGLYGATAGFSMMLGFFALHPPGFKANYMDVTALHGGLISGVGNTIASVASSIGPPVVAYYRESSGSWSPAFNCSALLCIASAAVFCTTSSTVRIEDIVAAEGKSEELDGHDHSQ